VADVKIHPGAESDYEDGLFWYFDRSVEAADRFESAFDEAIEAIRSSPAMFPFCDDAHRFVLLKRYPYRLVYRWDGETVHVIAVAHMKRRPGYWSDRS
jgi:plasmid stabilization system protein ParE